MEIGLLALRSPCACSNVSFKGTWEFLSAQLGKYPTKRHQLQDDLESFVHVVMYTTLRYMKNDYDLKELSENMERIYEKDAEHKLLLFSKGLTSYMTMTGELVLPYAASIVLWVEGACGYVKEWLDCPYSVVKKNQKTQTLSLVNPGPVPDSIRLHSHDALLRLWNSQLAPDLWKKVLPVSPCDNLSSNPAELMYEPKTFGSGKRRAVEQSGGQPKKRRKTKTLPT